ncbi:hypothetical protein J4476_00110 [Candidatus Woesearchaeota archaeon]|nr:hypothetical protein [Candidatus Woesearchaeota archaeon]HIH25495.1 hypothetical protein [Nanoarchaeota archaeon]
MDINALSFVDSVDIGDMKRAKRNVSTVRSDIDAILMPSVGSSNVESKKFIVKKLLTEQVHKTEELISLFNGNKNLEKKFLLALPAMQILTTDLLSSIKKIKQILEGSSKSQRFMTELLQTREYYRISSVIKINEVFLLVISSLYKERIVNKVDSLNSLFIKLESWLLVEKILIDGIK